MGRGSGQDTHAALTAAQHGNEQVRSALRARRGELHRPAWEDAARELHSNEFRCSPNPGAIIALAVKVAAVAAAGDRDLAEQIKAMGADGKLSFKVTRAEQRHVPELGAGPVSVRAALSSDRVWGHLIIAGESSAELCITVGELEHCERLLLTKPVFVPPARIVGAA